LRVVMSLMMKLWKYDHLSSSCCAQFMTCIMSVP
jgi:hypothetical protein